MEHQSLTKQLYTNQWQNIYIAKATTSKLAVFPELPKGPLGSAFLAVSGRASKDTVHWIGPHALLIKMISN